MHLHLCVRHVGASVTWNGQMSSSGPWGRWEGVFCPEGPAGQEPQGRSVLLCWKDTEGRVASSGRLWRVG